MPALQALLRQPLPGLLLPTVSHQLPERLHQPQALRGHLVLQPLLGLHQALANSSLRRLHRPFYPWF